MRVHMCVCARVLIASGVENVKRIGETKVNFVSGKSVDCKSVSFRFPAELSRNAIALDYEGCKDKYSISFWPSGHPRLFHPRRNNRIPPIKF